ncbi:unnamed protein product [Rotaria sordida]|uniref:B box-type domain-containing protein n=1 Tax=Rotaria sordida TaxID=392033 RepID=A0A818RE76_9BILA|nr:unnamed protein product [Rotaria sordida]CAF0890139.1 unnamed protein product [Rotaria sordida]CAF1130881.1 unnamed protein product [Rotaria sordida]CAF1179554.1 unnamed protein product [Rotaria sordida]CAF1393928.1 unnamed protein product [Rotaria sordida]
MHNNNVSQRHCAKCGKTGGLLICEGCQLTFCSRHAAQHRQELAYQLENIMQEHHILQQNIERSSNEYFHLQKIDKWEKESIRKIKIAAEIARADLRQLIDKPKRQLIRISRDIAYDLNSSMKTDDFSEKDLIRWIKKLNDLRLEIRSSYSIELIEDQRFPIYPIVITHNKFPNIYKNNPNINNPLNPNSEELFFKTTSSASIENGGIIIKHIGPDLNYAHILGKQFYSQGRHTTRFKIVQCTLPYIIFFGCISSNVVQKVLNYNSSSVVGWFGYNEIYQHGIWNNNLDMHDYDSNQIQKNDILNLTFDCDRKEIELFHERINKTHRLQVDIDKAPFPWQILVVLVHEDDCVRILPKR